MAEFIEVFVRPCVSRDVRLYEVFGRIICEAEEEHFTFPITKHTTNSRGWNRIGPTGRKIISRLHGIEGVDEVFISHTTLTIIKSREFPWEYVESDIIHTLEVVLGPLEVIDE